MLLLSLSGLLLCAALQAQDLKTKKELKAGNEHYEQEAYEQAIESYSETLLSDSGYAKAHFNLGNALFKQGKYDEAREHFAEAETLFSEKRDKANTLHNIGNSFLEPAQQAMAQSELSTQGAQQVGQQLKQSMDLYKEALRLAPNDEASRENLSYAKQLFAQLPPEAQQEQKPEDEQQQEQQKDEDKKGDDESPDKQDQQEEQPENQDPNKDGDKDQGKEEQEKQEGENGDEQGKNKPPIPDKGKEQAERQLDLLDEQEKELQDKLNQQRAKPNRIKVEKDW